MGYKTKSELTDKVCDLINWSNIGAIKTMERNQTIYARATLLKPNEVHAFKKLDGMKIDGKTIKTMNFK